MKQYTPSELARLTGVTARTIRYYDQRGLLAPAERGKDGYRYYDSQALLRMQRIVMLKYAGFSLGEIRDALEVTDQEDLWQLLQDQKLLIGQRIQRLTEIVELLEELSQTDAADPDLLARSMKLVRRINGSVRAYQFYQENGAGDLYPWEFDRLRLQPGQRVLDAGCGVGMIWRHSWRRIPEGLQVDALDVRQSNLEKLKAFCRDQQSDLAPGASFSFLHENVEKWEHEGCYDQILMAYLTGDLESVPETLDRLLESLKPGGYLNVVEGDNRSLAEADALYQDFFGESCLQKTIARKNQRLAKLNAALQARFVEIEDHVFQNDLTFTDPMALYRYLTDLYSEMAQELAQSGTDFIAYLRQQLRQRGSIQIHSQVHLYRCRKEE